MSDFELRKARITAVYDDTVLASTFENEAEQRREKVDRDLIGFKIQTPALTYSQFQSYLSFYTSRRSLTSFTFTSPFDNTEYTVRFVKGSFESSFQDGHYRCSFEFKRL